IARDVRSNFVKLIEFLDAAFAGNNLVENSLHPTAAFSARGALPARLVTVESHHVLQSENWVGFFRKNNCTTGSQHTARRAVGIDTKRKIEQWLPVVGRAHV